MAEQKLKRVLILNRGEIACRIIQTLSRLGITSIAVYQAVEQGALHCRMADEAYLLPEDYLDIDGIIELCQKHAVDAIHPGYGFLSENHVFCRAVEQAGMVFIGPPARAIQKMGDKVEARRLARELGVSLMPGADLAATEEKSQVELEKIAEETGYPVLLKAAAGGGGKAMSIVKSKDLLHTEYLRLREEAESLYHNSALVIEHYLEKARHVEVQVLGNCQAENFVLFDRDCSLQRNNQKVIEEAPALAIEDGVRASMHSDARKLADAVGYTGAGTVEFLYDHQNGRYYFLEMNTRLQVEHTVTEMVTGLDLVEEQLKIAAGQVTRYDNILCGGHAIQARICAETPDLNFTPHAGDIVGYQVPATSGSLRIDSGIARGSAVLPHYDNMMLKLVSHAENRDDAIDKLMVALGETIILGVHTNIPLLRQLLASEEFRNYRHFTRFISTMTLPEPASEKEIAPVAAACIYQNEFQKNGSRLKELTAFDLLGNTES